MIQLLISINISYYFEPPFAAIYQLVDSSQVKFTWFSAQQVFHKCFHLILLKKIFVKNEKSGNHLI